MLDVKSLACSALLAASAICGPALAEDAPSAMDWRWSQTGGNFDVVWPETVRRLQHGGGAARLVGGGDDAEIVYADTPVLMQAPAIASLTGGGDNAVITYATPASGGRLLAGQSAMPDRQG